jgi:hypothetical protein
VIAVKIPTMEVLPRVLQFRGFSTSSGESHPTTFDGSTAPFSAPVELAPFCAWRSGCVSASCVVDGIEGIGGDCGVRSKDFAIPRCGGGAMNSAPAHQLQVSCEMLTILLTSLFLSCAVARPSSSILRPLPKHYDAGDASVVFLKDRMNVLPEDFSHDEEGMSPWVLLQ